MYSLKNYSILYIFPFAFHIALKEAHVSCVPTWLVPTCNISRDVILLILTVIVMVDNIGSIMNIYVNFWLPINTSGSVMQSGPWGRNRDHRVHYYISHLLNFCVDIINSNWVIEINNHLWYISSLKGTINIKNDMRPIIAVADGMYRIYKVCVYAVVIGIWFLYITGHIINGKDYLVFTWCFNSRILFKEASEDNRFYIWTISLAV